MGSRYRTTAQFGHITLDILQTIRADTGIYSCKASNYAGEATTSISMIVKGLYT